jgi:hypothetical protein
MRTVPDRGLAARPELLKEGKNVSAIKYLQADADMGAAWSKQAAERLTGSRSDG